jgi:hypothetical protein
MTIEEKVKQVLAEEKEREGNPNFQNLREFYETMKKEGLVIKQEYTLPPVDTIGRSLHQDSLKSSSRSEQ